MTVLSEMDDAGGQATSTLGGRDMGVVVEDDTTGAVAFSRYYDQTQVIVDAMEQYSSFPPKIGVAKDVYRADDLIQVESITQLETPIPGGPSVSRPSYSSAIQKGFREVLTLSKTPEQVAEDTQEAVDAMK